MKQRIDDSRMTDSERREKKLELLEAPIQVVNVGLQCFSDDLSSQGVKVVQVNWIPPAGGNARLAALLSRLMD
jgi:hypothetical protein